MKKSLSKALLLLIAFVIVVVPSTSQAKKKTPKVIGNETVEITLDDTIYEEGKMTFDFSYVLNKYKKKGIRSIAYATLNKKDIVEGEEDGNVWLKPTKEFGVYNVVLNDELSGSDFYDLMTIDGYMKKSVRIALKNKNWSKKPQKVIVTVNISIGTITKNEDVLARDERERIQAEEEEYKQKCIDFLKEKMNDEESCNKYVQGCTLSWAGKLHPRYIHKEPLIQKQLDVLEVFMNCRTKYEKDGTKRGEHATWKDLWNKTFKGMCAEGARFTTELAKCLGFEAYYTVSDKENHAWCCVRSTHHKGFYYWRGISATSYAYHIRDEEWNALAKKDGSRYKIDSDDMIGYFHAGFLDGFCIETYYQTSDNNNEHAGIWELYRGQGFVKIKEQL